MPERVSECYCGRKRGPEDGPGAPQASEGRRPLLAGVVGLLVVAAVGWGSLRRAPPPAPAEPPELAASPEPRPLAPGDATPPPPTSPPGWAELAVASPPEPAVSERPAPKPTATASDSADAQRERGAAAFEAAMRNLSGRLTVLRGRLRHYDQVCPRDAIQVIGCDEPRREIEEAAGEIRAGLEAAEEAARQSWLAPGVQRAIRERSGTDDVVVGETLAAAAAAIKR